MLPDHVDDVMRLYPVSMYPTPKAAYEAFLRDAVFVCPARAMARITSAAMVQVKTPGKMAGWVAPPDRGINNLPVEYEYVHIQ